jgi:6-phospho-beta-glucosidase
VVRAGGAHPLAVGDVPAHARGLIETVKAVERVTIEAALTGSTALAVKALALHPLVPSVTAARKIFADYRAHLPVLEERFA